jgi:hypothetical protein
VGEDTLILSSNFCIITHQELNDTSGGFLRDANNSACLTACA